jgi:DNA-binding CsgD family transcriptional regulator
VGRPIAEARSEPRLDVETAVRDPMPVVEDNVVVVLQQLFAHVGAADDAEASVELEVDGARYTVVRRLSHPLAHLSPREREIARMVARGYTNKTIAAVLDISTWTVGTHVRRMFVKLQVHSRSAMVARLAALGELGAEDAEWSPPWPAR